MKQLPKPEVYEKEFTYMPWGLLISEVIELIIKDTPADASVLDLMCGPGYLLSKIHSRRKDLHLSGVDIDPRYVAHAKKNYKKISFIRADSLTVKLAKKYDVVLCTGGLHHLPYNRQELFIKKLSGLVTTSGRCIIADPYIRTYTSEKERRLAAVELGTEYLKAVIGKNSPNDIVAAAIDILTNDVLPDGEYKTYISRISSVAKKYFKQVTIKKTWPKNKTAYGDYYFLLSKPRG
jgi:SAM-dependent methyltransferase